VRGKDDPYTKIGQVNDRTRKQAGNGARPDDEYVWALKDVNFSVEQGEVLGVIGRNGAGKSTLLRILSRVTSPSSGRVRLKGRIASLLEVGTGFHPELTGRENIFLNGAILGMRRNEIARKLDEIVDFSGCAAYLDTPVKRYSSGMTVRMAFAVAAFLEAEILVIDEVLAVGDAEFQKKCLGKMGDVASLGRTLLFVSHNMATIQRLCGRVVLLENGTLAASGAPDEMVQRYFRSNDGGHSTACARWPDSSAPGDSKVRLRKVMIAGGETSDLSPQGDLLSSNPISILVEFELLSSLENFVAGFELWTSDGTPVLTSYQVDAPEATQLHPEAGMNLWQALIPPGMLNQGDYTMTICLAELDKRWICRVENAVSFRVTTAHGQSRIWRLHESRGIKRAGVIAPVLEWRSHPAPDPPAMASAAVS
jgi:lipopolysaccharide transport system ATP-binding protein